MPAFVWATSQFHLHEVSKVADLKTRMIRAGFTAILALVVVGTVHAQSREARISERLQPEGRVCMAGEPCAAGGRGASSTVGSAPSSVAEGQAFNVEQVYQQSCAVCHNSGMAGAPKLGDDAVWASAIEEKGIATLVQNAITGIGAMPPRGMCMTCSDENIDELVKYLAGQAE
jgi:cytochrome c5